MPQPDANNFRGQSSHGEPVHILSSSFSSSVSPVSYSLSAVIHSTYITNGLKPIYLRLIIQVVDQTYGEKQVKVIFMQMLGILVFSF